MNPAPLSAGRGKAFGRYELLELISSGGMGEVYRARLAGAEGFRKYLALKRIYPHLTSDPDCRRLFVREAKVVSELAHPNIVQVLELGTHGDDLFIAMEFVDGVDLGSLLHGLSACTPTARAGLAAVVAFDTLEALDYAHNKRDRHGTPLGLVHRDVSPQNILIDPESGLCKLCDFGVMSLSTEATNATSVRGKLAYMAPEQARGETLDVGADIFAVGAVLFRMMTDDYLLASGSDLQRMESCQEGTWPDVASRLAQAPPALAAIIARAVEPRREDRYHSAAAMRADIEALLSLDDPREQRKRLREVALLARLERGPREPSVISSPTNSTEVTEGWKRVLAQASPRITVNPPKRSRRRPLVAGLIVSLPLFVVAVVTYERLWSGKATDDAAMVETVAAQPETPLAQANPATHASGPPAGLEPLEVAENATPTPRPPQAPTPRGSPSRRAEAKAQAADGTLNLNAIPWAYVSINGKRLPRTTPLVDFKLPAGDYDVVLQGPDHAKSFKLRVRAGATTTKVVDLRSP